MSKFIQTNTRKERLQCPKCRNIMYKIVKDPQDVVCRVCGWDGSFIYPDIEGEK